jgi:glutaredoxin 2
MNEKTTWTLEKLQWAIDTIRNQEMFGRDELGASLAREKRAKGVMLDTIKFIEEQMAKEIQETKQMLETQNSAEQSVIYCEINELQNSKYLELKEENTRLRKALEFYADQKDEVISNFAKKSLKRGEKE